MLLDTDAPSLEKVSSAYHRYFSDSSVSAVTPTYIEISDAPINCHYGTRFQVTATGAVGRRLCWYNSGVVPMVNGEEYTLSVYARLTSGTAGTVNFMYGCSPYLQESILISNTSWERYSWTFTYDSAYGKTQDSIHGARIYIGTLASNICTMELCGFQLEKGNKLTDWSLAPEDVSTTINSIERRVTSAETSITQNAEQIALRATKEDVMTYIDNTSNLLLNSSFSDDFDKWTMSSDTAAEIVTEDNYKCCHIVGTMGKAGYVRQSFFERIESDPDDQVYTLSADIKLVNYTAGTSDPYLSLYLSGLWDDNGTSTWLGSTRVSGSVPQGGLIDSFSDQGWVRVVYTFRFAHKPISMAFSVYSRDWTGDLYFKNIKLERGDVPTKWSAAPEDISSVASRVI